MATFSRVPSKKTRDSQSFPRYVTEVKARGLKEGILHKRQRGQKTNDLSGLKFQPRYCVLKSNLFSYYRSKKDFGHRPSGSYQISKIKIVETVPDLTFRRQYCFQIGNEKEVMYFSASSDQERKDWIETFSIAAFKLGKNEQLLFCHIGAYGQTEKNQWSCCNKEGRDAKGCLGSTPPSVDEKMPIPSPSREDSLQSISVPLSSSYHLSTSPLSPYSDSDSDHEDEEEHPATCPGEILNLNRSRQSIDSGKGGSTSTLNTATTSSPAPSRQKTTWDKSLGSATIVEEDPSHAHSLTDKVMPFVYMLKTTLLSEEDSSYASTVLYKGVDSVIVATNTGKVSTSTVNTAGSQKQTIFDGNGDIAVSVSIWRNHIAFGSEAIYLGNIDSTGVKILGSVGVNEGSPQLVAFCPDGSFFSASKGGYHVSLWSKREDGSRVKTTAKLSCTLKVAEDDDQIFSLTVSPKRSWLAIGVTSSNSDFVHIYHFKDRFNFHGRIEIGQESGVRLAFTHDGEYLFVGSDLRIQCFDISDDQPASRLADCSVFSHTFKKDGSITSLACSPVRHHLAVGLSTGEVNVFTGNPRFLKLMSSTMTVQDSKTQSSTAVTALSYSRDGMKTAVAFHNGTVQIWKGSRPLEEPNLIKHNVIVTSKSQTVDLAEDGCSIFIPEGAVKEGTKVTLHYGVAPHSPYGPFEFDEGAQPVSPILLLCPEPANTVFLKPIEVTLPHFISCETPEDCNRLSFSKARHDNFVVDNSRKIYQFEKVLDGKMVQFTQYDLKSKIPQGAATLYTQHCCYICIQEDISEEETNSKKVFSLSQIVPKHRDYARDNQIYYCLSYHLKTCIKTLNEQFPDDLYVKSMMAVSFLEVGVSQERVLKIQLHSESGLSLPGGWALQVINGGQIAERNLCFWDDEILSNIEELCQTKEYPPKIPLLVVPGQDLVREGVSARVSFTGVRGLYQSEDTDVKFMLELTLPQMPPRNSVSSGPRHLSLSSSYASHDSASPITTSSAKITPDLVQYLDLQDQFYDIANTVDYKRLASALFTESSSKKCPYLSEASKKKTISFLTRSRAKCDTPDEKFSANYDILVDASDIAKEHPQYKTAIQAALNRVMPGPRKDGLGESVSTASMLSPTTAEHSLPAQEASLTPPIPRSIFPTEYSQSTPNDNHSSFILPFEDPPPNPIL